MGVSSSKKGKDGIYAEIVSEKMEEADIPPIQILLNERITSSAVESLKDSKQVIQLLAESLVYDTLHDKDTPKKFGEVLQYVFSYESTLANTRSQLYWAINTPDCFKSIESLTAWQLKNYFNTHAIGQLSFATKSWVVTPQARKTVICPLLTWTFRQQDIVITPLAHIIQESLPFVQDPLANMLKSVITENLQSEQTKTAAKDVIVGYLLKVGKARLPTPPPGAELSADATGAAGTGIGTGTGTSSPSVVGGVGVTAPAAAAPSSNKGKI